MRLGRLGGCLESLILATTSWFDSLDETPVGVLLEEGSAFRLQEDVSSPFEALDFERTGSCCGRVSPPPAPGRLAPMERRPTWP